MDKYDNDNREVMKPEGGAAVRSDAAAEQSAGMSGQTEGGSSAKELKPVEEMSERELLMELVSEKRRRDKLRPVKIAAWALVVIAVIALALIYVPKINDIYNKLMDTYDKVQVVYDNAQDVYQQANEALEQARGTMDNINSTINDRLNPAIDAYSELRDSAAQKLQEAADGLSSLTERIRNLFSWMN